MNHYEVRTFEQTYTMYELREPATQSAVTVCPARGGIATSLILGGKSLFYLDEATLLDPNANIRGGNPILFPICGQLEDKRYAWEGASYEMPNHGVARIKPWEVMHTRTEGAAAITLRLSSDEETLRHYPFDFELEFTYILQDGALRIEQRYANRSAQPMPMYAGFHPYFAKTDKTIACATDATRYLDYNDGETKTLDGPIDLGGLVESVALLDAKAPRIAFSLSEQCTVHMAYSDHFRYVVLWSVEGKPFVCVEPWMALTGELNRRQELPEVPAGETLEAWMTIGCS
ncbi:aldose epimerase [Paenibacillus sp. IB182496]|uniref:Aldose epimerase n=1 Tax=Paenibacillus sabuli TaxID=2772509 RepID=A0A927BSS3_9BACL|nr:aldose epimerase [Paenibacillus sabuli]MBD2844763.1 aldose epimerase [Paenibacillus sabuli]